MLGLFERVDERVRQAVFDRAVAAAPVTGSLVQNGDNVSAYVIRKQSVEAARIARRLREEPLPIYRSAELIALYPDAVAEGDIMMGSVIHRQLNAGLSEADIMDYHWAGVLGDIERISEQTRHPLRTLKTMWIAAFRG